MAQAKPVVKAVALDKIINASVESLSKATSAANLAVTAKSAEAKKLTAEDRRHTKKKGILTRRNKLVAAKLKKSPDAANKKTVATVAKELKMTTAVLDKARASKAVVAAELSALKVAQKRLTAYSKAIATVDKALNAPKKKRKVVKKPAVKKTTTKKRAVKKSE